MKEMQNEESAQYNGKDVLTMIQDLDVNKEFEEGPTNAIYTVLCVPEEVEAQYIKKDGYRMIINMSHTKDNKARFVRRALYLEMQHEGNAKTATLFVPEDFDVNAEQMQEACEP